MTGRFWPFPDPQVTIVERLLLLKADIENFDFFKIYSERLVSTRKQPVR